MRKAEYPPDHKPGMKVPVGGSNCQKCRYLVKGGRCSNDYFVAWHGSDKIPAPVSEYCSDWFEPKNPRYRTHEAHPNNLMNDRMLNEGY